MAKKKHHFYLKGDHECEGHSVEIRGNPVFPGSLDLFVDDELVAVLDPDARCLVLYPINVYDGLFYDGEGDKSKGKLKVEPGGYISVVYEV